MEQTRAGTRALIREAGLVNMSGLDEGDKLIHGLLAVQEVARKHGGLPMCLVWEAGPEPVSISAACYSEYSDVWMEAMRMKFDGLVEARTLRK